MPATLIVIIAPTRELRLSYRAPRWHVWTFDVDLDAPAAERINHAQHIEGATVEIGMEDLAAPELRVGGASIAITSDAVVAITEFVHNVNAAEQRQQATA